MRPLSAHEIRGNWATVLLPLRDDDTIDFCLLEAELDYFISARVNGVYSNGSAGEFHAQSEDEFDRICVTLAAKCGAAVLPFQIGVSHSHATAALARLVRAKPLAPSAFQVTLPDWFPPSMPEALDFLRRMAAEAAPIPLVIYNPPHAKRRLAPEELGVIAREVPGVVGMKVSGGDDAWYQAMKPVLGQWSVFIPGHLLADGLRRGAHGAYSNVACLSPTGAQRWYELCVNDPEAGAALGLRIGAFWAEHIAPIITRHGLSNMAADKAAVVAGGWLPGFSARLRWPYRSATSAIIRPIAVAARASVPELFP